MRPDPFAQGWSPPVGVSADPCNACGHVHVRDDGGRMRCPCCADCHDVFRPEADDGTTRSAA